VITDADNPALLPKNSSNAGTKSWLDKPCRYSSGNTSVTFGETAAPRRQERRTKPAPLTGDLIDPPVIHAGRGHLDRAGHRAHLPRPRMTVAHHQPPPILVPLAGERGQVRLNLRLQRRRQHPPRTLTHDLIQTRRQLRTAHHISDYLQHRRPSRRRWPAGIPVVDQSGRYAAPSLRSRIHNFES
jgi:hypothetical protein